jgi:hypothetical protein
MHLQQILFIYYSVFSWLDSDTEAGFGFSLKILFLKVGNWQQRAKWGE